MPHLICFLLHVCSLSLLELSCFTGRRGNVSWRGDAQPEVTPGPGALASVPQCYGTQQVRGLFFFLIQGDYFVLSIYSLAHRHLRTGLLAEQLLQVIQAKGKWECRKEKGFRKLEDKHAV